MYGKGSDWLTSDLGAEDEEPFAGEENIDMDDVDVVDEGAKRETGRKKHGKQTPNKGKQPPADSKPSPASASKSKAKPGNSTKPGSQSSTPTKSKRRETKAQVSTKTTPNKVAQSNSTRSKKAVVAKDSKKASWTTKAMKTLPKPHAKGSTVKQNKAKAPASGTSNTAVGFNTPAANEVGDNIQVATPPVIDLTGASNQASSSPDPLHA